MLIIKLTEMKLRKINASEIVWIGLCRPVIINSLSVGLRHNVLHIIQEERERVDNTKKMINSH